MSNDERRAELDRRREAFDVAAKNREVFTSVHTIQSIPSGLFVAGLLMAFAIYFIGRSFFASFLFMFAYFPLMYFVHKEDVHGFKIWLVSLGENTVLWEAGRRQKLNFIITQQEKI